MKLTAFLTAYIFRKSDDEKNNMVKQHIKNEYVPYEKKVSVADAIVRNSYWQKEKDEKGNEYEKLHVNSSAKYMMTCMAVVDLYTDIERQKNDGKMLDDFNALNSLGILDKIISNIDSRELKEFNMVIQMACDDVIANEFENHAFISKQVNRFGKLIGTTLLPIVSQLDLDQIKNILKQIE